MTKAHDLRKLFREKALVRLVGAHNGLSAKLAETVGFDGIWASGLEISTASAVPDASILTMTDYLAKATEINEAISIPVVADCDTGYGNSNNVIRLVKKYESAGIGGICIEDKQFPKINSLFKGRQELAPIGEFVGKILAAKHTQENPDFMVIARVEALIAGLGLDEALLRAREYEKAGADAILIHHKKADPTPIRQFIEKWTGAVPLVLVPTNYPSMTEDEMKQSGKVKMVIYANQGIRSIIPALKKTYTELFQKGIVDIDSKIASLSEVFEIQGMPELRESESMFREGMRETVRCIVPGAGDYSSEETFEKILQDRPLLLLDVYGKVLIQRTIESLNDAGVYDVTVIVGPHAESVQLENARVIQNPDYKDTFIVDSLMRAREYFDSRIIMVFSDILFDSTIIERLLASPHDITLAVDPSVMMLPHEQVVKLNPDLVETEPTPDEDIRFVVGDRITRVIRIGKKLNLNDSNYEFIGLASFSKNGIQQFVETYDDLRANHSGSFHESVDFSRASITDMFQELIDRGIEVNALEVRSGWSEIRTFKDYQRVVGQLAGKEP